MYPMIYQELACIGGIAIDRELKMLSPNMKNSPMGECFAHNDGGSRGISGQQS
jgi:hypothetical protein